MDNTVKTSQGGEPSNATVSFGIALAVTSVASALLVIAKEKSARVMTAMKSATGHHWATHSVFAVGLFFALGFGLSLLNGGEGVRMTATNLIKIMVTGIAVSCLIIAGFYLIAG